MKRALASVVLVQVLAINDFHGHLEPPPGRSGAVPVGRSSTVPAGGAAHLAAHVGRLEGEAEHSVFVSAGDLVGASPIASGLHGDAPTVEALDLMGLDVAGVGNHEFDEGPDALGRLLGGGAFDVLAANVTRAGRPLWPAHTVRRVEGVRIAFIGLTLHDTPSVTMPDGTAGLAFAPEAATVNRLVRRLRRDRGIRAFVVLLHEGGRQAPDDPDPNACEGLTGPVVGITRALDPDVDVVASGHTHEAYVCRIDGTVVTSAASFGRLVTDVDLRLDRRTGDVVGARARNVVVTRDVAPDPAVQALVDDAVARAAPVAGRVVGDLPEALSRTAVARLAAEAQRDAAGTQGAVVNLGGVRGELDAGPVTYGELFAVQPFGDEIVVKTLTGAQLERALDQQEAGGRLVTAGLPEDLDPVFSYSVAMRGFLAAGGDGFTVFREAMTERVVGTDVDVLADYLAAG